MMAIIDIERFLREGDADLPHNEATNLLTHYGNLRDEVRDLSTELKAARADARAMTKVIEFLLPVAVEAWKRYVP